MTTVTSTHSGTAPPAPQGIEGTVRRFPGQPQHGATTIGNGGRRPSRWSPERERPEDDEALVTAVPAAVTHRSFRERPEDDEVILTYTVEPACRRVG